MELVECLSLSCPASPSSESRPPVTLQDGLLHAVFEGLSAGVVMTNVLL